MSNSNACPMTRRTLLFAGGAALAGSMLGCGGQPGIASPAPRGPRDAWRDAAQASLAGGVSWLWDQQSPDGAFRSTTYGLLSGGQSLTPFALLALERCNAAGTALPEAPALHAIEAMRGMLTPSGALGLSGVAADYPCYATGMLLSCLGRIRPSGWREAAAAPTAWLRDQQLARAAGWRHHPAQGGWGMGGPLPRVPPDAGHVDLSMTRRVIEGLRDVGTPADDPALREALSFVLRCQASDGAFFYSPTLLALNKGRRSPEGMPAGYGSATSDGLLCLAALGLAESPRARRAHDWLLRHHAVDRNPGLVDGPMQAFAEAMRGYYRAGASRCFQALGGPEGWRSRLAAAIVAEQHPDGSWSNPSPLQKENDPLIATAFAITALSAASPRDNPPPRGEPQARRGGSAASPRDNPPS